MTREELTLKAIATYNGNLHSGMTTALGEVVNMVLEEAAMVAEDCSVDLNGTYEAIHIAAAIRALKG